jgi:dTDP-4-amino-4,6-dideoxygalactose transaminase
MTSIIPFVDLSDQHALLQEDIVAALRSTLDRGDFICGEALSTFEASFAQASGSTRGIGVACGTDAIALGLTACGIGPGDEVLLPANTFVATLLGVLRAGATPVLVDCELATGLIDLEMADRAVTSKTKAIIAVHLYGQLVSPKALWIFAKAHELLIFEDAAQAHLAERDGAVAGSLGMAAAFSFYPSKNLGALGDGGMLVTSDDRVDRQMRTLRNYGAPRKYYHSEIGTNSRLDTFQAAVLQLKLPHLKGWNQQRNDRAADYDALLAPLADRGIRPMENHSGKGHVYHLYVVRLDGAIDRDHLMNALDDRGIQTGIHYPLPCHLQPAFHSLGYGKGAFPCAEQLSDSILSLPMYPGLSRSQVETVATGLDAVLRHPVLV